MTKDKRFQSYEMVDPFSIVRPDESYEELQGGEGKQIHYRQERYNVAELLKEVSHLNPRIDADTFRGPLVDFAITGASCLVEGQVSLEPGQSVDNVRLVIGDEIFYSGNARVVHKSYKEKGKDKNKTRLGLQLLDKVLDINRIFRVRSVAEMVNNLKAVDDLRTDPRIKPEYKQKVDELVYLLTRYRTILDRQERELFEAGISTESAQYKEILDLAWETFQVPMARIQQELEELTQDHYFDRPMQELYRQYTMPLVTPHFIAGPMTYRCWYKPLGYPGDYIIMTYIYDQEDLGDNLFGKLMHRYATQHPAAKAVRGRKKLIKRTMQQVAERIMGRGEANPVCRIMSLGSGPAREAVEFVDEYNGPAKLDITLIDQDNQALGYVNRQMTPLIMKSPGGVDMHYLYVAFAQLLMSRELFGALEECDLVYCSGLFDYLSGMKAKMLVKTLFSKVKPDGTLIIGNFGNNPPTVAWTLSYTADWNLRYRNRQEMEEMASVLEGKASQVEVVTDETGHHFFIIARKPA